jgi:hypothetical protein
LELEIDLGGNVLSVGLGPVPQGGDVYGLDSIFDAAREHELPAPATAEELSAE